MIFFPFQIWNHVIQMQTIHLKRVNFNIRIGDAFIQGTMEKGIHLITGIKQIMGLLLLLK